MIRPRNAGLGSFIVWLAFYSWYTSFEGPSSWLQPPCIARGGVEPLPVRS